MTDPEDDKEALEALQKVRDDLDGLRTRLKQVPHPATVTGDKPHASGSPTPAPSAAAKPETDR